MSAPEASLAKWGEEAEAAWTEFRVDRSSFLEKMRASLPEGPSNALPRLHHVELYLAHACALGDRQALTLFTRRYLTKIPHYLRRFSGVEALLDECRTTLEDKLLLSPATGGRPRIDQYSGRGPLDAWVAIVAQRTMLAMLRSRGAPVDSTSELCDLWSAAYEVEGGDAHRYLNLIKETLRETLQSLPLRQRSILRLSIVEDVSLTQIARMLHVNQSTVSRAFHASLEKVNRQIRARLKEAHGMGDSEVDSVVRQLQSRIDLSLSGLFAEAPELVASLDRALAQSG